MSNLKALPEVNFCETDGAKVEQEMLSGYESVVDRNMAAGNPERLNVEAVAYIVLQLRQLINQTGKSNLLAHAKGEKLDHLGALTDTPRLPAYPAVSNIRFELGEAQDSAVTIPKGTRITPDSKLMFATDKLVEISAGNMTVEVGATCQTSGAIGNGFIAGQLNRLVDPIAGVVKVANTGTTLGGAEVEKDDPYRERVQMSPEKATTAGPEGQYISFAKSVHQDIVDIAVDSPTPGKVDILALMRNGELPPAEILLAIISRVSPKDVRPLTDNTEALAPEVVDYEIELDYWIGSSNSTLAASIQKAVDEAVDNFILWQKSKLGRDVSPTKLTSMLEQAGATKVSINHPQDIAVSRRQVAILSTDKPSVNYKGLKDD